jgi:hypothetical protein
MELGEMGLKSPSLGGRGMTSTKMPSSKPLASDRLSGSKPIGRSSSMISGATTGMGSPPVKNLGSKIISALRQRRKGMGAPRSGRRM